jgi:glyoxylase-like metal-dependent hydrolase (beta-lactamase superfamily II)
LLAVVLVTALAALAPCEDVAPGLRVVSGAVNGAVFERGGETLVVYGDPRGSLPRADMVLLTHHRRDVAYAARGLVEAGARAVVPAAEIDDFNGVDDYWSRFRQARFHDYEQQTTKILLEPLPVHRPVRGGEVIDWQGLRFRVLDTPGYTRGAVTYLVELEDETVAFTGDLVYGDGRLFDLYSLQDFIRGGRGAGYHGFTARLADLIASLERVAAAKPDVLVPARGPVIRDPSEAIERLQARARAVYANYVTTDALRWHFGDDELLAKARRVLGPGAGVEWMKTAETLQDELPDWLIAIQNTRVIRAADGSGFVIDCGNGEILDELKKLHGSGVLSSLDHVFISHYHDDHTDSVPDLVKEFGTTVYAVHEMVDVLENPAAYRLPAMTARPIPVSARLSNGAAWRWKEFELTAFFFPGQTLYHQALLVEHDSGERLFFVGDSFSPSGLDDYCPQNRDLLHEGMGFFDCLDRLRRLPPGTLLVNQHVRPAFGFSTRQIDRMEASLNERVALLRELVPWDDPNFALDEGWARFRPYAARSRPGGTVRGAVALMNHSPESQVFRVRLRLPLGWVPAQREPIAVSIPPRQEGRAHFSVAVPRNAAPGLHMLAADIDWGDWALRSWTEMMVEVDSNGDPVVSTR